MFLLISQICYCTVPRRCSVRASWCATSSPQSSQLYKGGRGFRISRKRVALLPSNARVPCIIRHAHESRRQIAD